MPLFNEGNTKQPKANKLVALKTQSYKYLISILIKTLKNYLQCLGIKDYRIERHYYVDVTFAVVKRKQFRLVQDSNP